jgi:hypothetical protein
MKPKLADFDDGPGKATEAQLRVLQRLSTTTSVDALMEWLPKKFGCEPLGIMDVTRHQAYEWLRKLDWEAM